MTFMSPTSKDQNAEENPCKVGPVSQVYRGPLNFKKNANDLGSGRAKKKTRNNR
jgi:hypothetical protein